jgi:predicted dehydrogenase
MSRPHTSRKPIRVGVVGVGRGMTFVRGAEPAGMQLVALCDTWQGRLREAGKALQVATYTDYDRFLEHDLDAVVLANYFHEHAPFAVKALDAGRHVMSECAACHTPAEGVALARAVERSGRIYMFAENYPYSAANQEMRRLFRQGLVGKFIYGEGEYIHPDPAEVKLERSCGRDHWRNWLPWGVYYCTHAIAPVMHITGTRPKSVSAFVMPYDHDDPSLTMTAMRTDVGAALMLRMDNGAVVKALTGGLRGHGNFVRIHGNRGLMETVRGDGRALRVVRESWEKDPGEPAERIYRPDFPIQHELAAKTGHGGGDFFTSWHFAEAIRSGRQPFLDVYRGLEMSLCGIQGWRSALAGGIPQEVPDFRSEAVRKRYEEDGFTCNPAIAGHAPPSVLGEIRPSRAAMALARKVWRKQGYTGR